MESSFVLNSDRPFEAPSEGTKVQSGTRKVARHGDVDVHSLEKVLAMQKLRSPFYYAVTIATQTWILFNAVTTIMVTITNFLFLIPQSDRLAVGLRTFDVLQSVVLYFPLAYFVLLLLVFNNMYSESAYYHFLHRNAIIDFPDTGSPKYLLTHPLPLLFCVSLIVYVGVLSFFFARFSADFGTVLVVVSNLVVGVALLWFRQQAIEDKFVSLTDYVQAFPDADGGYDNIDEHSLGLATQCMVNFVLTEAESPSYSGYMRGWWWKKHKTPMYLQIVYMSGLYLFVGGIIGGAYGYFRFLGDSQEEQRWDLSLNPAVSSCVAGMRSIDDSATVDRCSECICIVLRNFLLEGTDVLSQCTRFFKTPAVNGTVACPFASPLACPGRC